MVKLAGRGGAFDLEKEFGVSAERLAALDQVTRLAIAVGIDAMRDAGIPLVMRYKTTSKGTQLPDRWGLPDALRDDTGVIFGSAFPGYDSYADEMARYYADHARREQLGLAGKHGRRSCWHQWPFASWPRKSFARSRSCARQIEKIPYVFDRRFLLRTLVDGTFAIRRIHRRARSQHANQLRLCHHHVMPSVWQRTGSAPDGAAG